MLFSDIALPQGLNGLELAKKLREVKPGLKVILSSSYSPELLGTAGSAAEGIVYLQKPYQIDLLSKVLRNCFACSDDSREPRINRGS